MAFSFSDITNKGELALFLNIPLKKLTYMLYIVKPENSYTSFEIPKRNGGKRIINAPTEELKSIQRGLAQGLWEHQQYIWKLKGISPSVSHAFEKKKSIITNARIHRNKVTPKYTRVKGSKKALPQGAQKKSKTQSKLSSEASGIKESKVFSSAYNGSS